MATAAQVIDQGLALSKKSRKAVVARLWESLDEGHQLPPTLGDMLRRVNEIKRGEVVTFSREEVDQRTAKLRDAALKRIQSKSRSIQ